MTTKQKQRERETAVIRGAKASGLGREGARYAIEEMTERRLPTLKLQ